MEKQKLFNTKKHSNKETNLKDEVSSFIDKLKKKQHEEFNFWRDSVGKELAEITIPLYIKNDVLFVKVPDDIRRFELTRGKDKILKDIKINLINYNIQDIVFI